MSINKIEEAQEFISNNFGKSELVELIAKAMLSEAGRKELAEFLESELENFESEYGYK